MVDIESVTVGIVEVVRAVQRVDSRVVLVPRAGVTGLPAVGQGVAVRIDFVGIGLGPIKCGLGRLPMRRQTLSQYRFEQVPPHILAQITESVAVGILVLVRRIPWVQCPEVAAVVSIAYPPAMLHLPAIRHPVAVGIWVGRISGAIRSSTCT